MFHNHNFLHKICDPIHGFIRFDSTEKKVIDSRPFQRLRSIHQMGVAFLIYPGARHSRFEHSLGVMELASRLYDTLTNPHTMLPGLITLNHEEKSYWRRILRLAALCHDMGHLPFSHTAEKALLPEGGHEQMTVALIQSEELSQIWEEIGPHAKEDILKLSIQEKELQVLCPGVNLSHWERVLSKVITEDNFGADRIDYLIRDAYYTGVGYGHFDTHQLIDTLRLLPEVKNPLRLTLGITESGIQSVESLWMARYLMYARVYHHPKSIVYTHHMRRFIVSYYREKGFSLDPEVYLQQNDHHILAALNEKADRGNHDALVLLKREKPYVEVSLDKETLRQLPTLRVSLSDKLFIDEGQHRKEVDEMRYFSVLKEANGKVVSSVEASQFLREIPLGSKEMRVFIDPEESLSRTLFMNASL